MAPHHESLGRLDEWVKGGIDAGPEAGLRQCKRYLVLWIVYCQVTPFSHAPKSFSGG